MIEIRTLGSTSISVDGVPLAGEAAWPRSVALIVYMAREPGPDKRAQILTLLWPDREEKRARRALNQLLYTLRKSSPGLDLESIEDALDFGTDVWLDVDEFERRLESGDLEGAVELFGGQFLSDLIVDVPEFDHWADRQRAAVHRKFRNAALELAERAKHVGEWERSLGYCRRVIELDQLDDEAQHLVIESLYLSGDRVAALRRFDSYKELLGRELQVEPLEHTMELVERIRAEPVATEEPLPELAEVPLEREKPDLESAPALESKRAPAPGIGAVREAGLAADEIPEPVGWLPPVSRPFGRRGLAWLGGAAAVVAGVVLAIAIWPPGRGRGPDRPFTSGIVAEEATRIAVLPFRAHGLGLDQQDLAVAMAQLLAMNLDGVGPIGTVDHRTVLRYWEESGLGLEPVLTPDRLGPFARDLGAASVLLGTLHGSGDEYRIIAELLNAGSGQLLARADVRGSRNRLFDLTDQLTLQLLEGVWTAAEIPAPQTAARSTNSLVALKHYLKAEDHYRRAEWEEAIAEYRLAVARDSTFVPAIRSLAETIIWAAQERRAESAELFERARRLAVAKGATERDRLFDEARYHFTMGDGAAAVSAFEDLADRYPKDFSIQYEVADAYFHFGPRLGISLDRVARQLEGLLVWDSAFAPAIDHLWWTAMWRGDEQAARRWSPAYEKAAPAGTRSAVAPIATAMRYGDEGGRQRALVRLLELPVEQPGFVFLALLLGPDADPDQARAVAEALTAPDQPRARRALGAELTAALQFATGRPTAGDRWLGEAERLGIPEKDVAAWRALVALYRLSDQQLKGYPAPGRLPTDPEALRGWVRDTWLHGAIGLRAGDPEAARRAAEALSALPGGATPIAGLGATLAAGLRGELALSAADTAGALEHLRGSMQTYAELALLSEWETVPCYRYLLGRLEAAQGNPSAAIAALRSLDDRSIGDVLYRARMYLALGDALEAVGEAEEAAKNYRAAARWWERAEAPFAEETSRARAGVARTGGTE